ncbi:MAG: type II toxin-antitoxin system RelE/ParE family toxin [Ignavibacteriales bacterium]|nr:type II toxin-antitoxin system RelE/ParE family toxin [Ignavibacteriales bacterium]
MQAKILTVINSLAIEPRLRTSKKLQGTRDRWRARNGDYRILYRIDDETKSVYVYRALHRKDVYR